MAPLAYPEKYSTNIFTKGNKRGQFYLLSAIIIISIIIGFSTISTYTRQSDVVRIVDLAEELDIETINVLDFTVFSGEVDSDEFREFITGFADDFAEYAESDNELSFIIVDPHKNELIRLEYRKKVLGEVSDGNIRLIFDDIIVEDFTEPLTSDAEGNYLVKDEGEVIYKIPKKPGRKGVFKITYSTEEETYITRSDDLAEEGSDDSESSGQTTLRIRPHNDD